MTIYDNPRPRSFIDLCPRLLGFNTFKLLFLKNTRLYEAKFHREPPWDVVGIPVMRYDRAARPCALNFRLAALKCRFGRPPDALSSVGV